MASDPTQLARDAYISYVKERGHIPQRTVHLFNFAKYSGFKGVKFVTVKQILSSPPEVSEYLKKTLDTDNKSNSKSLQSAATEKSTRHSAAELYKMYQDEHDGKHPSTVARFHHFCQSKGASLDYAQCSMFWVRASHLRRNTKRRKFRRSRKQRSEDHKAGEEEEEEKNQALSGEIGELKVMVIVNGKLEEERREINMPKMDSYMMDEAHVKQEVKEHTSEMKFSSDEAASCMELFTVFEKIDVSDEQLGMWAGYGGGRLFSNKSNASTRLKSVLSYVDTNKRCSEHIQHKMKVITKLILDKGLEKSDEYIHILLLLASHGNVCNVMKEVAIGNAYGILTDKMDDFVQQQTLQQQVLKVLRDFRVLQVEAVFHAFKMTNNTHYIAGFHNILAPTIGVIPYNDEHICTPSSSVCKGWENNLDKRYFAEYYTKSHVVKHILEQISEKKIGYQKVVRFLEDMCPKGVKKMHFLEAAIDIDTGKINEDYIAFMLEKFGVLKAKPENWKPVEKCWDDIVKKN